MFDALDISASGLTAQRIRVETVAANLANMNTTRNQQGENVPYRRRFAVFAPGLAKDSSAPGVHVQEVAIDQSPFREVYDPTHPDANPQTGNVLTPNIDLATETVNAMEASRAYTANITAMEVTKSMINASLRLLA